MGIKRLQLQVQPLVLNSQYHPRKVLSNAEGYSIRAIAPSYGVPVVLHTDHCAKKLLPCSSVLRHI